jgi:hypothetical protein
MSLLRYRKPTGWPFSALRWLTVFVLVFATQLAAQETQLPTVNSLLASGRVAKASHPRCRARVFIQRVGKTLAFDNGSCNPSGFEAKTEMILPGIQLFRVQKAMAPKRSTNASERDAIDAIVL